MGRKAKGPRIYWRNGRAYGDFRTYEDVGRGREALAPPGRSWATSDQSEAEALFTVRLNELRAARAGRTSGVKDIGLRKLAAKHVEDVSFDRGTVTSRPNTHRRLKTKTSHRTVPLWPQLREILQAPYWAGDRVAGTRDASPPAALFTHQPTWAMPSVSICLLAAAVSQ